MHMAKTYQAVSAVRTAADAVMQKLIAGQEVRGTHLRAVLDSAKSAEDCYEFEFADYHVSAADSVKSAIREMMGAFD